MTSPGRLAAPEVLAFLCRVPLFSRLQETSARRLAAACRVRQLDKGERIFLEAGEAECAYLIRSGRISIVLSSPDGRELAIEELHAGEIFGEVGLLTRKTHCAGAVARSRSELLVIPRGPFLEMLDQEPQLTRRLLEITADRLHRSTSREMALAFMNAHSRLAGYLLALEEQERDKGYITASQEDLARGTGLIRQTVAKALGRWRRDGWLLTGRGRILILDRKALEQVEQGHLDLTLVSPK